MNEPALDLDALMAFVLVAETRSFTRAAEMVGSTQSAMSLRIKRLEETLGRRLLDRTPRQVKLSADGTVFLPRARDVVSAARRAVEAFGGETQRLRLGVSDHLVGRDLPRILRSFATSAPDVRVELEIAPSAQLLDKHDAGKLDAVIVLRHDAVRRDGIMLAAEPFAWMAAPDFVPEAPLQLATHAESCSVRSLVLRALARSDRSFVEVFSGGGLGAVSAAVEAGLAVAAMSRRTAPLGAVDVGAAFDLPKLPLLDVVMHTDASDPRTRRMLDRLARTFADKPQFPQPTVEAVA